jgi:hypothetical protein
MDRPGRGAIRSQVHENQSARARRTRRGPGSRLDDASQDLFVTVRVGE